MKMVFQALVLTIFLTSRIIQGNEGEPRCYSKYDFEEKVLEKVIRTEMTMQQYMEKLEKALETMTANVKQFEETMKTLEQTNEDIKVSGDGRMNDMEQALSEWRQDRMLVPTVAFNVRKAKVTSPVANLVIVFQHVLVNLGGGYDEDTGKFTAPVNGTYMFATQVCSSRRKYGIFQVAVDTKENVILVISDYDQDTTTTSTSGTAVVVLTAGQKVWVQNQYSASVLYDDSQCWNQFTGTLIHI